MMSPYEIKRALTLLSNEENIFYHAIAPKQWICYQVSGLVGVYRRKADALDAFWQKYERKNRLLNYRIRPGVYNCHIPYKGSSTVSIAECRIERITSENLNLMKEIALKSMLPYWYFVKETPEYQAFHGPTEVNR